MWRDPCVCGVPVWICGERYEEAASLRDDPSLDVNAIDELLRFVSPVQFSRLRDARATIPEFDSMFNAVMDLLPVENPQICYQCDKAVKWLAPDGRCDQCTRLTPEEIRGE